MLDILEKEDISIIDINQIIEDEIEESIHLDFKAADSLNKQDKKKMELAKDVSSFANSAGGYIIYGINEKNHKADSLSFVDGEIFTKEWIEQIIQTRIQRKIDDLKIIPIRVDGDLKKSIYIVKIPESYSAPHMTSDKRFYKRYNFESVQMEEYEIRNLYNRNGKSKLKIGSVSSSGKAITKNINEKNINFKTLYFNIENKSKTIERDYKLFIHIKFKYHTISWDVLRQAKNISRSIDKDGGTIISIFGLSPIYPDENLNIGYFELGFPSELDAPIKCKIKVKLMYSNGNDETTFNFESW
ncbi:AlbA family DNA-binding domain-containing protein [Tenacibaculum finnmarkense]|uniref:AlbA family DNA-binding domain-containing protein n=1 Tax=Tenacibaculum finnmarkense TaxID=2781243 RepID=UPI001E3E42A2|nr:ATP-binding protein [Tenacibaculum finnmarkense]MCD8403912.1 ATP-binding protein [Tenacibaculum finnmarkense genomovar finnmarkense]